MTPQSSSEHEKEKRRPKEEQGWVSVNVDSSEFSSEAEHEFRLFHSVTSESVA